MSESVVVHPPTPYRTETHLAVRPVAGVFLHNTETDGYVEPHDAGSWHVLITRDGTRHRHIADADVAWGVRVCDRWYPRWLPHTRPWGASPANCWGLHIEVVSSKRWRDQGRPYTAAQYTATREQIAEWRRLYGPLPVVGHGLVQGDRTDPVRFDWEQLHDPLSLFPLAGTSRVDPRLGGLSYLQLYDGVWHPGVDLNAGRGGNADEGAPVPAPVDFTVRYVGWHNTPSGRGFGWHLWGEATTGHWLHVCHLSERPSCAVGEVIPRGRVFGLCGRTQGWDHAHVHFEVTHRRPAEGWDQWPRGWSLARIEATYVDPFAYLAAASGAAAGPVEEEAMPILNEAQLVAVQAGAWGERWSRTQADFAIPRAWRQEVQAGRHPGRPVTDEQDIPGADGAVVMWFETGRFAVYVPGQEVSWNG